AVPNLTSSSVTITDGNGAMLSPNGDSTGGGGASKTAAENRYDAQLSAQLNAIVAQTVGANKAQVRVKSDLNVDATQRDELSYAKQGTPIETTEDTERLKGTGGAGASGAAGAKSNIPTYAAGAGGSSGESVGLRQIEQPRPVAELAAGHDTAHLTSNPNRRRQQVEQAVNREPERVVQALRGWMAEDEG